MKEKIIKFLIVGMIHNCSGYFFYIILTKSEINEKISLTVTYFGSLLIGFLGNKKYTFKYKNGNRKPFFKFIIIYLFGYLVNLFMHASFILYFNVSHYIAQLMAIFFVGVFLFLMCNKYVFTEKK